MNRHFTKEDIQMTNKHQMLKRLLIREVKNQNHTRIPLHIHKDGCYFLKRKGKKCEQGYGEIGTLLHF